MKNLLSFSGFMSLMHHHLKEIIIGVGVACAAGVGIYGYMMYRISQEEQAQVVFVNCMDELKRAYEKPDSWPTAELASVTAYRQHSSSSLAPYFLALEVQALVAQGKLSEAITSLERVIGMLSTHSPFYSLYTLQLALMKLDSSDEAVHQEGLKAVEKIALDQKNKNRDQALYYLGEYYASQNNQERAKEFFHQLVVAYPEGGMAASPWASLAQKKLHTYSA